MAIAEARLEIVKYLISQGANVFAKDGICDRTMLHYAVQSNNTKMVSFLLAYGIDHKIADIKGMRPIHLAAKQGNIQLVEMLCEYDAYLLQIPDLRNRTVLDFAIINKHFSLVQHLLEKYAFEPEIIKFSQEKLNLKSYKYTGVNQIICAILCNASTALLYLLNKLPEPDHTMLTEIITYAGLSPSPQIMQLILDRFENVIDLQMLSSCFISAIFHNRIKNIAILLPKFPNAGILASDLTAVEFAAQAQANKSLALILDYYLNNNIYMEIEYYYFAMYKIIEHNNINMAKILLNHLQAIDERSFGDNSYLTSVLTYSPKSCMPLLHYAAQRKAPKIVALLLMCGATDQKISYGSALELAQQNNDIEAIEYLSYHPLKEINNAQIQVNGEENKLFNYLQNNIGADFNAAMFKWLCHCYAADLSAQDAQGNTLLHIAIKLKNNAAINTLCKLGCEVDILNNANESLIHIAKIYHPAIFTKFLIYCAEQEKISAIINSLLSAKQYLSLSQHLQMFVAQKIQLNFDLPEYQNIFDEFNLLTTIYKFIILDNFKCLIQNSLPIDKLYQNLVKLFESKDLKATKAYYNNYKYLLPIIVYNGKLHQFLDIAYHSNNTALVSFLLNECGANPFVEIYNRKKNINAQINACYEQWWQKHFEELTRMLKHNFSFYSADEAVVMIEKMLEEIAEKCQKDTKFQAKEWIYLCILIDAAMYSIKTDSVQLIGEMQTKLMQKYTFLSKLINLPYFNSFQNKLMRKSALLEQERNAKKCIIY